MTRIRVNPELLTWARERDGLESLALAARFPKLCEWEAGELKPTLCQLEDFAHAVHVAVGYLFLPAGRRCALCRVHAEPHSGSRRQCHPSSSAPSYPPSRAPVACHSRGHGARGPARCAGVTGSQIVPRTLSQASAGTWPDRDDHPRQAQQPPAAIPTDGQGRQWLRQRKER